MAKFLRLVAWLSVIIAASIGALRLTAIRWWQLPMNDPYFEASLAPTLRGGDWVILWRATTPGYGDLVLCPEPKTNRPVIGRIVGEAGDQLKIEDSTLSVNNSPVRLDDEDDCPKFRVRDPGSASGNEVEQSCSREIVGPHTHLRGNTAQTREPPKLSEFSVPTGQVFLVSDNRALPWDSRDFGPIDRSACAETVVFRLVSKDGFFDVPNRFSLIR